MTTNVFKFLWQYFSRLKIAFFGVLLCILCGDMFFRFVQYYGSQIADLIASSQGRDEILSQSLIYVGLSLLFLVFHRIGYDVTIFVEAKFLPVYISRVAKDLFNYAHKHSTAFFAEEMAGNVASKIKTIIDDSYNLYYNFIWGFVYPLFSVSMIIYFVFQIHINLALIMLGFNVIYVFFVYKISRKISPYSEDRAKKMSEAQGVLVDSISNAALVKSFDNYLFEKRNFFGSVKKAAIAERVEIKKFGILFIYQGIFRTIMQISFCIIPIYYWYYGQITVGQFVLIQSLVYSLSGLYLHFTQSFMNFFKFYGGIQDGLKLLAKPYEVTNVKGAKAIKIKKAGIKFDNITYHYKGSEPLFKDFSIDIKSGEKLGLVGHSGSGKSTFVKILSRYYDIQEGTVTIDGQNIAKVTQESLRKNIALIPQDPSLFNRTIMENIRYGNVKATDKEIFEASKKAYIHDFIMALPNGYDSKVGERGVMLSGGERQRIAIARAILKNAPILILDEATSALDSSSEKYIQDSMKDLMQGKTVIAIAHRLSTLKEMDRIIVMDNGKIVEEGTHLSLLRKKGTYHKFFEMQSQGFLGL